MTTAALRARAPAATTATVESLWALHPSLAAEVDAYGRDVHAPAEQDYLDRKRAGTLDKIAEAAFAKIERRWRAHVDRLWNLSAAIMEAYPISPACISIWLAVADRWEGNPEMSKLFIGAIRRYAKAVQT